MEGFQCLPRFQAFEVICKQTSLLDSYLGYLRMTVRVFFFCLETNIADSKYVCHPCHLVKFIDCDSATPVQCFFIDMIKMRGGYTTDPNEGFGCDSGVVIQYDFSILIVCYPFIQYDVYAHLFQEFLCVLGCFGRHYSE